MHHGTSRHLTRSGNERPPRTDPIHEAAGRRVASGPLSARHSQRPAASAVSLRDAHRAGHARAVGRRSFQDQAPTFGTNLGEASRILDEFRAWRSEPGSSADRGAERTMDDTQR
jgi:hypothetical protein